MATLSSVLTSQRPTLPSHPTARAPSCEKANGSPRAPLPRQAMVETCLVDKSHSLRYPYVPLWYPAARVVPSGENATEFTEPKGPSVTVFLSVAISHNATVPYHDAAARVVPSGENATASRLPLCPEKEVILCQFAPSHSLTVPSWEPEAKVAPSDENETERTSPSWASMVAILFPVATSHSLIVPSHRAEARVVPSGENEMEMTVSPSLSSMGTRFQLSTSQRRKPLSPDPQANEVPSGENNSDPSRHPYAFRVTIFSPVLKFHTSTRSTVSRSQFQTVQATSVASGERIAPPRDCNSPSMRGANTGVSISTLASTSHNR